MDEKRAKFLRVYAEIPKSLRSQIIVVLDEKTYTWNTVYFEIKNNTKISKKLLNTILAMELI